MNIKPTPVSLGVTALAALAALCAFPAMGQVAQTTQGTGWYAGGNVGRSAATIDVDRIRGGLAAQGLATSAIDERDTDVGYKLYGGYQWNRHFAVEAGYFDLGRFGYTATTTPAGTLAGDIRVKGLNVDLVGILPITQRLSALARVGVTSVRTEGTFSSTGAALVPYADANPSRRNTNAKFGAGLAYQFTDSLALRLEAERYRIDDAVGNKGEIDMVSVGLIYRFGGTSPAPRAAVSMPAAPAVVAAAPAPAPMPPPVVVVAAPPAPIMVAPAPAAPAPAPAPVMRVTLSADSLFDFDRSTVKPAGRQSLDKLAADLRGVRYDLIEILGHTDRLGASDYNLALSERRAAAVREHLMRSGIPPNRFAVRGQGEANPVTASGECVGTRPIPSLIACLQPDRRVEVDVQGTR